MASSYAEDQDLDKLEFTIAVQFRPISCCGPFLLESILPKETSTQVPRFFFLFCCFYFSFFIIFFFCQMVFKKKIFNFFPDVFICKILIPIVAQPYPEVYDLNIFEFTPPEDSSTQILAFLSKCFLKCLKKVFEKYQLIFNNS